ncbi:amino acid adenylation domain-containing protein, partial [Microbulbifer sp. TYP-18]|uniref:amino acid adenylation domain-containing protein n=1 Tax=Microbulbifer sp. TYP-18 TaxID=3230024 RepID=UPI0034C64634
RFIALEQQALASKEQQQYWQSTLQGAHLPWWSGREKAPSEVIQCDISLSSSRHIIQLARRLGVQEKSVWCAIYLALLSLLDGSEEVMGLVATQGRPEIPDGDKMVGVFVNALPIQKKISGLSWEAYILQVDQTLRAQHGHRHYPLSEIQRDSDLDFSAALFNYTNWHVYYAEKEQDRQIDDNSFSPTPGEQTDAPLKVGGWAETNYLLLLDVFKDESRETFGLDINADIQIFSQYFRERIRHYVGNILRQLETRADKAIDLGALLSDADRQHWQALQTPVTQYPNAQDIYTVFARQAEYRPDAIALVHHEEQISYGQLQQRARELSAQLHAQGIGPESRVGLCMDRCVHMVVGMLATLRLGGCYVPLDPHDPPARLAYILKDSGITIVLTQAAHEKAQGLATYVPVLDITDRPSFESFLATPPAHKSLPTNLAYINYTSGSTGKPKGVLLQQKNVLSLAGGESAIAIDDSEIVAQTANYAFDAITYELWTCLLTGARLVIVDRDLTLEGARLQETFVRYGISTAFLATALFNRIGLANQHAFASLDKLIMGGEACSVEAIEQVLAHKPRRLINGYGPTECTTFATTFDLDTDILRYRSAPVGRPLANNSVYILNHAGLVPVGVVGELCIGGTGLARGYLNQAKLTAEKFIPNPFSDVPGERLYRSGDLARLIPQGEGFEGQLEYLGRVDQQVKIRGFRIEMGEIENVLGEHAGVDNICISLGDRHAGSPSLIAYLVNAQCQDEDKKGKLIAQVQQFARARLASYMLPTDYVVLDKLPLTANGKVDYAMLPNPGPSLSHHAYVAPESETEILLSDIWQRVLGVETVGCEDNFFQLGGHSLMVMQVIAQLRERGVELSVEQLFRAQNLAELAKGIDAARAVDQDRFVAPENGIPENPQQIRPDMLSLVVLSQQDIDQAVSQVDGGVANIKDIYPLGPLQEGILFVHTMSQQSDPFIINSLYKVDGAGPVAALIKALQFVIDRHDILRTAFVWQGLSQPLQVVLRRARLAVEYFDLQPGQIDAELNTRMDPEKQHMVLEQAPLLRLQVGRLAGSASHYVIFQFHHLVLDHVSLEIIVREVAHFEAGEQHKLPQAIPYRQYIAHVQHLAKSGRAQEFFRSMLTGVKGDTELFGLTLAKAKGGRILEHSCALPNDLAARIRETARVRQLSPSVIFHSAYAMLIGLCSGRDDVTFGTVLSGRLQGTLGAESMPGLFINTLPLRVGLGRHSGESLILEVKEKLQQLVSVEYEALAVALKAAGLPAGSTVFSALLNYRHSAPDKAPGSTGASEGLEFLAAHERTNYPFSLAVNDFGEHFSLDFLIDERIQMAPVVDYFLSTIRYLMDQLSSHASGPLMLDHGLPADVRTALLVPGPIPSAPYPLSQSLLSSFEHWAAESEDALALVSEAGGEQLTYGELAHRANRLAHALQARGVGLETPVGVCLSRGPSLIISAVAILKAGAVYVPLEPSNPAPRMTYILSDSQVAWVISDSEHLEALGGTERPCLCLDRPEIRQELGRLPGTPPPVPRVSDHGERSAYLIYTSGSTGQPKGVVACHRAVLNRLCWQAETMPAAATDVFCQKTRIGFVDHVAEIFQALHRGRPLVILEEESLQTPVRLGQWLRDWHISHLTLVPSLLKTLLASGLSAPGLKVVTSSGEALWHSDLSGFEEAFPGAELWNLYGSTEVGADVSACRWSFTEAAAPECSVIGQPIANLSAYVLGPRGELLPPGVVGELCIAGTGLAHGYVGRGDLTAERFVPHPFSDTPGERLYCTGDRVRYLPDGSLDFIGRLDGQVNLRGFRIELGEIEHHLRSHEAVQEAVAALHEAEGEEPRLLAYVRVAEGLADPAGVERQVRESLKRELPAYMQPSAIQVLPRFPRTVSGKLDRQALPVPSQGALAQGGANGPQGTTESLLASLWQALLQVPPVGREDNFFELGGHSLLATQLVSRIRAAFGVDLPIRCLFEYQTLKAQARALEQALKHGATEAHPPLVPVPREPGSEAPLSYAQQRLWFLGQYTGPSDVYNMPLALEICGQVKEAALLKALAALFARHESLRTCFRVHGDEAWQVIDAEGPALAVEAVESEAELQRIAAAERHYAFDLAADALCRVRLLRRDGDLDSDENGGDSEPSYALLLTMHHSISDGWSLGIVFRELIALYEAFAAGEANPLAPLPVQYADFAHWQRQWLRGEVLERQLDYWRQALADLPPLLTLPTDRPRPPEQRFRGGFAAVALPAALSQQLQALSQARGVTLFMTLQSAFAVLLGRYAGQDDVAIGTPIANRTREETEGLIGFFVNSLVLRSRLDKDPSFNELLVQSREASLQAYAHQDIPFEMLVEAINPVRSRAHSPLFQVMFALQNLPVDSATLPSVAMRPLRVGDEAHAGAGRGVSRFDLTLTLHEGATGIEGGMEYNSDLFEAATIARWLDHYQRLLAAMVASP